MSGPSLLSRLSYIGLAKEATQGIYVAPTVTLPITNLKNEDLYGALVDETLRNNDSVRQGLYQGPGDATFDFDMPAYPDLLGHLLRASIGPDTVTAAAANTTLSAAAAVGATTINVTSATGITVGQALMLDTGSKVEYVQVVSIAALVVTIAHPLQTAHASAAAVVSATTHTFAQSNTRIPSYSLTDFDVYESRGFPGCVLEELDIKIDPKGMCTLATKWKGFPSAVESTPTPSWTQAQPLLGWQWTMTNGGASSNRGISYDVTIKREVESIHASTGTQAPEEVFPGALTMDGKYKARFVDDTDLNLFLNAVQQPVTALLTQPAVGTQMGATLAVTTSQGGFYKGSVNRGGKYIDADFDLYGINNATDGGSVKAVLTNFTTTAY